MASNIESNLMSFGKLLAGKDQYAVPHFQRDYSWTDTEVSQLWDDIVDTIDRDRTEHFMGAIVVDVSRRPTLLLIDGQQRLATISILVCVLKDIAYSKGDNQLCHSWSEHYLGGLNYRTRELEPKLVLNEMNNGVYRDYIMPDAVEQGAAKDLGMLRNLKRGRGKSDQRLLDAYILLHQRVQERIDNFGAEAFAEVLIEIEECVRNKLIAIEISVQDLANAYLVFETLNDRGLTLSVSDLLKNHLFSTSGDRLHEVRKMWEQISSAVGEEELPKFIRYFWLSRNELVRNRELYRVIRDNYKNPTRVYTFTRDLKRAADDYVAFSDSNNWMWKELPRDVRSDIEELALFKTTQCYPVLLAARASLTDDKFPSVLRLMTVLSFRYSIICAFSPNRLEFIYNQVANDIMSGKRSTPKTIFDELSSLYPSDETFMEQFANKTIDNGKLTRHILIRIEDHLRSSREIRTNVNPGEVNLEHILPKKPNNAWYEHFSEDDVDQWINRLGNMTLLDASVNSRQRNSAFETKVVAYSQSTLGITKDLTKWGRWTKEEIETRQREMARVACAVWRVDF